MAVLQVDQALLGSGKKLLQGGGTNDRGAAGFETASTRGAAATADNILRAVNSGASLPATSATAGSATRLTNALSSGPASNTVSRFDFTQSVYKQFIVQSLQMLFVASCYYCCPCAGLSCFYCCMSLQHLWLC